MKAFNGRTIVKVPKRLNDTITIGGQEFYLDPAFRVYWNTVHMAEVITADRDDIEPGDIVYVHHFVNAPEQRVPLKVDASFLESNQIYAKIKDGKVVTLQEFILVEPITYGELGAKKAGNGLIMSTKSESDNAEKIGIARHVSDGAKAAGIEDGDKVIFNKNCEYEILIEGKLYYRMELRDVIMTVDDTEDIKV